MPRQLDAIEIAEGALLADIAVILQLLSIYLPYLEMFFRLLTPTVFAVLVLRRRLYAAIVCLCVTLFIVGVMSGLNFLALVLLQAGAGLYLGVTMKRRLHHVTILLLGVTSAALTVSGLTILLTLLSGLPLTDIALQLRRSYQMLVSMADFVAPYAGLAVWWRQRVFPTLDSLAQLLLTYWVALFLAALWAVLWPVVIVVYYVTNVFVRLLGYDVRPFPGGRIERLIQRAARAIIAAGRRRSV